LALCKSLGIMGHKLAPVRLCATMEHMTDNPRLTSVVFRLNRDRLESLKDLSKATRVRQSEYLREAISDLLEKYEDKMTDA
jgi:hypothetical protein